MRMAVGDRTLPRMKTPTLATAVLASALALAACGSSTKTLNRADLEAKDVELNLADNVLTVRGEKISRGFLFAAPYAGPGPSGPR